MRSIEEIIKDLPCREPRGSPQNLLRGLMFPLLVGGLSREEAEKLAREEARAHHYTDPDCPLRYK